VSRILGLWADGGDGAKLRLSVLAGIKNRSVQDWGRENGARVEA
jgi:hypothetical protein